MPGGAGTDSPRLGTGSRAIEVVIDRRLEDVLRWTVQDPARERQWRNPDGAGVQELERLMTAR